MVSDSHRVTDHPETRSRRRCKLTTEDVRIIRSLASKGATRATLAFTFNVGEYAIRDVVQYRTYAWLED